LAGGLPIVCFDTFPLRDDGETDEAAFIQYLTLARTALDANAEFWATVQVSAFDGHRAAAESDIRDQAHKTEALSAGRMRPPPAAPTPPQPSAPPARAPRASAPAPPPAATSPTRPPRPGPSALGASPAPPTGAPRPRPGLLRPGRGRRFRRRRGRRRKRHPLP